MSAKHFMFGILLIFASNATLAQSTVGALLEAGGKQLSVL
jgi:hypothetical protein